MKKIVINGKDYPCRITMGAMVRFKRESGKDVSELNVSDLADLVLFMWCCVVSACNADDVEFGIAFDKFADLLEPSSVNGFYEDFQETEKKTTTEANG